MTTTNATSTVKKSPPLKSLGDRIRYVRESGSNPLTQQELADMLHVSARTLMRYEAGESEPKPHLVETIAYLTGASEKFLTSGTPPVWTEKKGGDASVVILPMLNKNETFVKDRREVEHYAPIGSGPSFVHQVTGDANAPDVSPGAFVQSIPTDAWRGPGQYIVSLDGGETVFHCSVQQLAPTRYSLIFANRLYEDLHLTKDRGRWKNHHGDKVDFVFIAYCVAHTTSGVVRYLRKDSALANSIAPEKGI